MRVERNKIELMLNHKSLHGRPLVISGEQQRERQSTVKFSTVLLSHVQLTPLQVMRGEVKGLCFIVLCLAAGVADNGCWDSGDLSSVVSPDAVTPGGNENESMGCWACFNGC
jgi:hypothetical protein